MKRQDIYEINKERFIGWNKKLSDHHATPVLLLAIGHDHNIGQLTVITTENLDDSDLLKFVEATRDQLLRQIAAKN